VEGGRRERDGAVFSPPRSIHRPFLLRRIKTDVETSLPSKKEILLYAQMTPLQKKLDKQLRDKTLQVKKKRERERMEGGGRASTSSELARLFEFLGSAGGPLPCALCRNDHAPAFNAIPAHLVPRKLCPMHNCSAPRAHLVAENALILLHSFVSPHFTPASPFFFSARHPHTHRRPWPLLPKPRKPRAAGPRLWPL
jgi:hypothetical protein